MNPTTVLMTLLGLALGLVAGALAHAWWSRRKAGERLRIPHSWPLAARGLVTTDEFEAWKWLRATFHDHQVMVKVPVLRFTVPTEKDSDRAKEKEKNERWLDMLNGVYTTFTICTADGKVVGCVDVMGKRAVSRATREMKERLLSDCGIAYTSVRSSKLPPGSSMRAAFLGEMPAELVQEHQETRGGDSSFHADLNAFTKQRVKAAKDAALKELNKDQPESAAAAASSRNVGFNPDGTGGIQLDRKADRFATNWEDSFIQPGESRPAKLE